MTCLVYGRLIDPAGAPVAGAPLTLTYAIPPGVASWGSVGLVPPDPLTVVTAADGSWSVALDPSADGVPAGMALDLAGPYGLRHRIAVPDQAYYNAFSAAGTAPPNPWPAPATCVVSTTFVDATGLPDPGVLVTVALDLPDHTVAVGAAVVHRPLRQLTAADGTCAFTVIRSAALTPTGVAVVVTAAYGMRARIIVPNTATADLADLI